MKIGVNLKINVTKIDKSKLFHGKNGAVYLDATAFIDIDNKGEYGDNGMIVQSKKKDDEGKGAILGNSTVFWKDETQQPPIQQKQFQDKPVFNADTFEDDIPF
tara:strand:+ start:1134 stop:1442 length:309 start_codon:yes stop_codon:yes gene_type:complete